MPRWIDDNLRRFWLCHLMHAAQGAFVAALLADGWPVAAILLFAAYHVYQVVEFAVYELLPQIFPERFAVRTRDRIIRDVKIYHAGFYAGLIAVWLTSFSVSAWIQVLV